MRRVLAPALAALALVAPGACGGGTLEKGDANVVAASSEKLDDAIDTAEDLRTSSRRERQRLVRQVSRTLGVSFELSKRFREEKIDPSFSGGVIRGSLEQLEELVPSLVVGSSDAGGVVGLNEDATRDFLRYAVSDPARALHEPAAEEIRDIEQATREAGPDTKIPTLDDQTVEAFLRETEGDVRPLWPDLARRLSRARRGLG